MKCKIASCLLKKDLIQINLFQKLVANDGEHLGISEILQYS